MNYTMFKKMQITISQKKLPLCPTNSPKFKDSSFDDDIKQKMHTFKMLQPLLLLFDFFCFKKC